MTRPGSGDKLRYPYKTRELQGLSVPAPIVAEDGYVLAYDDTAGELDWVEQSAGGGGGGGALVYLGEFTAAASSSEIDIDIPAGYLGVHIRGYVLGSTVPSLHMRMGEGSVDTGSNYDYARYFYGDSASGSSGDGTDHILLGSLSDADEGGALQVDIFPGYDDDTQKTIVQARLAYFTGTSQWGYITDGKYMTDAAVDVLRIYPTSGTMSATFHMWGYTDEAGGGGGGVDPLAGLASAAYAPGGGIEFDGESGGVPTGFTEVVESGDDRGNWVESGGALLYEHLASGTGTRDLHAVVASRTFSVGDEIETAVTLTGLASDFGVGLVMADGASFGSGTQVVSFLHLAGNLPRYNRLNAWTNWSSAGSAGTALDNVSLWAHKLVWLRMTYESANTFGLYYSFDGITWVAIQTNFATTLTPTHGGLVVVHWGNPSAPGGWPRFLHYRVNPSY